MLARFFLPLACLCLTATLMTTHAAEQPENLRWQSHDSVFAAKADVPNPDMVWVSTKVTEPKISIEAAIFCSGARKKAKR